MNHFPVLLLGICIRCEPDKPVRACMLCAKKVSCFICHIWRSTSSFTLLTALFKLHTLHFTLHTFYFTLHSSQHTLHTSHYTLPNPHFTLHTPQSTLQTSDFSLLSSHSTLHTPHFTLHSSNPHFSSFELFPPYPSSSLFIPSLLICHLSFHESRPSTTYAFMNHVPVLLLRNLHAPCASKAGACVLCAKMLQCCCPRTWPARDPGTMQTLSSNFTLHSSHPAVHTSHLHFILTHFI